MKMVYKRCAAVCMAVFAVVLSISVLSGCAHTPRVDYASLIEERSAAIEDAGVYRFDSVVINEVSLWNSSQLQALDGTFPRWIELKNISSSVQQLAGWRIVIIDADGSSTRFSPFPEMALAPGELKLLVFVPQASKVPVPAVRFAAELPESTVAVELVDASSATVDRFDILPMQEQDLSSPPVRDISQIRHPDLPAAVRKSGTPTPGMDNTDSVPEPKFALDSGFYLQPEIRFLDSDLPEGYEIRYTVNDGLVFVDDKLPGERTWRYPTQVDGLKYESPQKLEATAVVKARVYSPSGACSREVQRTYFVREQTMLPVISIITDPADLWDPELGIYTVGEDMNDPNFYRKACRLAQIEYFPDDTAVNPAFSDEYLIRIYGSSSRSFLSKSFVLYAKAPGSTKRIPNLFFEGSAGGIDDFYSIVLRNSGGDFERTMMRDRFMTDLATGYDLEKQDAQPAVVFLNGQYWGILNIREKLNEYFLEDHLGVDPRNVDIVEGTYKDTMEADEGTLDHVFELYRLIKSADPKYEIIYEQYESMIDIENFIDYIIFETFFNNTDWPWSNVKLWRDRSEGGKWRLILYDTDAGFDTVEYWTEKSVADSARGLVDYDMIDHVASGTDSNLVSTMFSQLIRNEKFFNMFIERYEELLDTVFTREHLLSEIDRHAVMIADEIPRHTDRWGTYDPIRGFELHLSPAVWERELSILRDFAFYRTAYVREHLAAFQEKYPPPDPVRIENGGFEEKDLTMWNLGWSSGRVTQEVIPVSGGHVGYLKILEAGKKPWDSAAFVYDDIFINHGETVRLSFDLRADGKLGDDEFVRVILFSADSHDDVISVDIAPGTDWKHHEIQVCYNGPTIYDGRLQLRVGTLRQGREIFIDNISMDSVE